MAVNDADGSEANQFEGTDESASTSGDGPPERPVEGSDTRVGEYTWRDFMQDYGYEDEVSTLYAGVNRQTTEDSERLGLGNSEGEVATAPHGSAWDTVEFDPEVYLGYHPDELAERITDYAGANGKWLWQEFAAYCDPETTPVVKDEWTWEHFKWEYHYEDDGSIPTDSAGEKVEFDEEEYLGFEAEDTEGVLSQADDFAQELDDFVEEHTVNVTHEDEDEFFSTDAGNTTVVNRYDLEKAVPREKKLHFREEERYWVNKPYAFVIIFHSEKENEKKYYAIEPYMNEIEDDLQEFMSGKLRTAIKYSDDEVTVEGDEDARREVIDRETKRLLKRYDLFSGKTRGRGSSGGGGIVQQIREMFDTAEEGESIDAGGDEPTAEELEGIKARPEPVVVAEDADTLNEYQVEKLLYLLKRNFIGYERIDPIKHDINVEDISCNGHNSPVFVYHSGYEQIISNIFHGHHELDDFVVKLAQRSGKGISKRRPQVDATLPDGSRAQLTLGREVSDHGTNYTIRQFNDVPFTPIDLINWNTFSLDEMAFLWLCIENHKSLIFAGGTASGKTTSLNAISLFIPSNSKIVSIEDTREVELPQRNWIASVTRPSFSEDSQGDVDEFDLLEAALRQRPDYIVMGEIRGEEGRTLFQVMSTGHTTYTTFHADSVGEVLKRFTTDPINVSKTMFTALDLVSIQTQTRVSGDKVRRNRNITEINHYDAENDEINVQDVYQWQAETDEFLKMGESNTLEEIEFDRGWNRERLENELFQRRVILAYLIKNGLSKYVEVAATVQAFVNDPETILALIANGQLEESLDDLREMESVYIDVDPEDEELVPRPDPDDETYNLAQDILERAEESLFEEYRDVELSGLGIQSAISGSGMDEEEAEIEAEPGDGGDFDFGGSVGADDDPFELGGDDSEDFSFSGTDEEVDDGPSWLSDEGDGFDFGEDAGFGAGSSSDETAEAQADTAAAGGPEPAPEGTPELEAGSSATDEATTADEPKTESAEASAADAAGDETDTGTPELEESASDVSAEFPALDDGDDEAAFGESEPEATDDSGPTFDEAEDEPIFSDADDSGGESMFDAGAREDAATEPELPESDAPDTSTEESVEAESDDADAAAVGDEAADASADADSPATSEADEPAPIDDEEAFFGGDDEQFFEEDDEEVDSIFGDESGGIFSGSDDDEGEDDAGMFDAAAEAVDEDDGGMFDDTDEEDDGSIFGGSDDDDDGAADGEESVFGDAGDEERGDGDAE
ncbi:ATPase, T2SS/T4P/T4SS family [Haloarchaeobius baliensis]|uniref:type II/IV secretion system ATPase subunit n=1 Tax=Haloarchaeobius baliensis TaxID=1670458 RepID=UPI003F8847EA